MPSGCKTATVTGNPRQFVEINGVMFYVPVALPGKNFSPNTPAQPYVPTAYPVDPSKAPKQ